MVYSLVFLLVVHSHGVGFPAIICIAKLVNRFVHCLIIQLHVIEIMEQRRVNVVGLAAEVVEVVVLRILP